MVTDKNENEKMTKYGFLNLNVHMTTKLMWGFFNILFLVLQFDFARIRILLNLQVPVEVIEESTEQVCWYSHQTGKEVAIVCG